MLGLQFIDESDVWQVGWIPASLGAAMLLYALLLAAKPAGSSGS